MKIFPDVGRVRGRGTKAVSRGEETLRGPRPLFLGVDLCCSFAAPTLHSCCFSELASPASCLFCELLDG